MHGFDIRTSPSYPNNTCSDNEDCRQPGGNSGYWLPCVPHKDDPTKCIESARGTESFCKSEDYPRELEHLGGWVTDCEEGGKLGCLFNIFDDPLEEEDLSEKEEFQSLAHKMLLQLKKLVQELSLS